MFGYVKPHTPDLLVKEYEFYKATYCGICRAMKKHTGILSNMTLSYDSVLLAIVRMLYIEDSEIAAEKKRCIAHPLKKRGMLKENSAIEYTARAFAILTYHKVLDDIKDERGMKRIAVGAARPIISSGARRADIEYISGVCSARLEEISRLEAAGEKSVDEPARLFGELLGEIFAYGLPEREAIVPREFGFRLGRFIYAIDAAEDYEEDRKSGKYNPYVLLYDGKELTRENKSTIKCALLLECREMEKAVDLMPFGTRHIIENIVKNIIYSGLVKRMDFLDDKNENPKISQE